MRLKCFRCKKEKDIDSFSKNRQNVTRLERCSWCRECKNAYTKERRTNTYENRKKYYVASMADETEKLKLKARASVKRAIMRGDIAKTICQAPKCEETTVHGHHYAGYQKEKQLYVVWLCKNHHALIHDKLQ